MLQRLFRRSEVGHQPFAAKVAADERVYAVGDVHGRIDLLECLLEKIVRDAQTFTDHRSPKVILLGDYIDRGDHSREVLDFLVDLDAQLGSEDNIRFEYLLGNHEIAMLDFLEDPIRGSAWLGWGGRQTLASYEIGCKSQSPEAEELKRLRDELLRKAHVHLPFLRSLKRYVVSGEMIFAHASLDPALDLEDQTDAALMWGRIPQTEKSGLPGRRLVHGHFDSYMPVTTEARICVDTGAYYSGRLTAVRLDDDEVFLFADMADVMD